MTPKKILFCDDFSENSEPARRIAVDYAKAFGAQLLIVHVVDTSGFPAYGDWVGDELNSIVSRFQESAKTNLAATATECGKLIPDLKTFCMLGAPAREIIALAAEESVDLIVMGTHGRTAVHHLLMGSIARSVLRTAHRPVLIVEA